MAVAHLIALRVVFLNHGKEKGVRRMGYRNSEGYSDPTAGRAISKADRMPTHVYNAYKILNEVAGLMGLEVTALKDRRTKQEWKR